MKKAPFQIFQITSEQENQTLSATIKRLLDASSWGDARKLIQNRHVQINGNLCLDPARRLTSKDSLKVWRTPLPKPVEPQDIKLVYVDAEIVVVEKPAGITSVRHFEEQRMRKDRRQLQPTLEELVPIALAHYLRKKRLEARLEARGIPPQQRGIKRKKSAKDLERQDNAARELADRLPIIAVHRLDRDTSGLMIFARTKRSAVILGHAFRKHAIDRRYYAVVLGSPKQQTFDNYLIRDRGDGHRGSLAGFSVAEDNPTLPESAQRAITHIRPIESIGSFTVVECKLETGRTHQIRIHLSEAGHPLCGDLIYWRRSDGSRLDDRSNAPRQALHSTTLRFAHPVTSEILRFEMPWPKDLQKWLDSLRNKSASTQ